MPHFILEYSENVIERPAPGDFFEQLHKLLVSLGPFDMCGIKSRVHIHKDYLVSNGERDQAFVHLELAILSGRDAATKKAVSKRLLEFIQEKFPETTSQKNCSFSVEIRDIESESYSKNSSGQI